MQSHPVAYVRLLFLAICLVLANQANVQHMNAPDSPCQSPDSNAEMTACFVSPSKKADEPLNKTYPPTFMGSVGIGRDPSGFLPTQSFLRLAGYGITALTRSDTGEAPGQKAA
jgi:hypothetical protein